MKPTVINNSSETSHPVHHEQSQQHPNPDNGSNNGQNPANNDHSRRFPQFRVGVPSRFFKSKLIRVHSVLA